MLIYFLKNISFILLAVSILGYVLVVIKEKLYLKENTILIDKKSVTSEHIKEANISEFLIGRLKIKTGDEISILLKSDKKFSGIVIGAKENSVLLVTHSDEVLKLSVNKIKKIKLISKYGRFF
ncbi:hypothetical protein [Senegalia sp. (in: firmicutes)]|uniref:hypothetical protein n=1 Tax=Senegalia sp. (in: firmicutes) TaxID=1924098 RepID=UPI003F9570E7